VKNNESVVKVQHAFRIHSNIGRRNDVPNWKTVMRWVNAFRTTGIITSKQPPGPKLIKTTPKNTERVGAVVLQSLRRSAHKQTQAL